MLAAVAADSALLCLFAGAEAVPDEPLCLPQPTKRIVAAVTMLMVCIFISVCLVNVELLIKLDNRSFKIL